jgi:polyphosphate kinase
LKARFDEANNIQWSRQLEEAGVHVVYGLVGYKIHCKVTLVVRKDPDGIRRYLHLSTGNYNPTTARLYTDIGLLTCDPDFGEDATNLFNLLTGICQFQGIRKFLVAPYELHARMLQLIQREADHARRGLPARIIAKMNSLVETELIQALYAASRVGVKIDLIVRGICCLRPGQRGLSENITVRSIVGRFLEHSRVFYFENACQPEVFIGSADWMPRNLFKRIEVVFPIADGNLRERIANEVLALPLADNVKARFLQPDGTYRRAPRRRGEPRHDSQAELIALALGEPKPSNGRQGRKPNYPKMKLAPRPPQ